MMPPALLREVAVPKSLVTEETGRWPWQEPSPQWLAAARRRGGEPRPWPFLVRRG